MCHNHFHSKTKQRTLHWHKLSTHITFITHCQSTRENAITIHNKKISVIFHQHGFKHKCSTHTALHNICHQIAKGFNNSRPLQCTIVVVLNMSKAFDTVNIHKFTLTNIPNTIIKFIASYIKRQACTQCNGTYIYIYALNTIHLPPNHKRFQQSKASTTHCSCSFGHEQGI